MKYKSLTQEECMTEQVSRGKTWIKRGKESNRKGKHQIQLFWSFRYNIKFQNLIFHVYHKTNSIRNLMCESKHVKWCHIFVERIYCLRALECKFVVCSRDCGYALTQALSSSLNLNKQWFQVVRNCFSRGRW